MQGSENAFLFLEDQNQKCFPWKGAEDSSGRPEPLVVGCGSWRRAREKEGLASRLPLTVGLKSLQPLAIADASASRDPSRQRRITLYAKRFRARAAPHRRRRITLYAKRFWRAPPPIERVDEAVEPALRAFRPRPRCTLAPALAPTNCTARRYRSFCE